MQILRSIGKWLGILILSFSLFLTIFMLFIVKFTEYDNLKSIFSELFITKLISNIDKTQLNQTYTTLLKECTQTESLEFSLGDKNITLKCEDVKKSSPEELPNLIGESLFHDIYYKEYDCEFIECLQLSEEGFLVILSSKANLFFRDIQNALWICTGIGTILIFVSVKEWKTKLKTLGITLLSISIPVLIIFYIKDYFLPTLPAEAAPITTQLFSFIFNSFLIVTIVGMVLTVGGYSLKFLQKKKAKRK